MKCEKSEKILWNTLKGIELLWAGVDNITLREQFERNECPEDGIMK